METRSTFLGDQPNWLVITSPRYGKSNVGQGDRPPKEDGKKDDNNKEDSNA